MIQKLKSRKLWAAVISSALVALGDQLGLDPDTQRLLAGIAASYILGQGVADAGANGKSQQ